MEFHQPVLLSEVIQWMNLKDDGIYCDCTVGGGGHLRAMLQVTKNARFIGIDWDPDALAYIRERLTAQLDRVWLFEDNFTNIDLILDKINIRTVDGILFDLGVSYHQFVTPGRGFSFEREGILSMQMSPQNPSLLQKIYPATKLEIAEVLKEYGDVHDAKKIGSLIYENKKNLKTTFDLKKLIESAVPRRFLKKNLHKVFQALRIWVNDELANLKLGILKAVKRLNREARILVISYHSGEDRLVKNLFRDLEKQQELQRLNKKIIRPKKSEIDNNPSSRSAKLRVAQR